MTSTPKNAAAGAGERPDARASSPPRAAADSPEVLARVHEELRLVDKIARALFRELAGSVMQQDLVSSGREGLLAAARSFDPTHGVPFHRWANTKIRGAMIDGVRSDSALPRSVYSRLRAFEAAHRACEGFAEDASAKVVATAEEADARLGTYLAGLATAVALGLLAAPITGSTHDRFDAADPAPAPDETLAAEATLAAVREAMESLPDQEKHLVKRHYFDDVRLDEAAAELGLSKSWGSRLHTRAIESLAREMKRAKRTM